MRWRFFFSDGWMLAKTLLPRKEQRLRSENPPVKAAARQAPYLGRPPWSPGLVALFGSAGADVGGRLGGLPGVRVGHGGWGDRRGRGRRGGRGDGDGGGLL